MEIAAHDTHENGFSLHPQPGILRSGHRHLQDTDAVPLLRGAGLHRRRLMVLYVTPSLIQNLPDVLDFSLRGIQQTSGKSSK